MFPLKQLICCISENMNVTIKVRNITLWIDQKIIKFCHISLVILTGFGIQLLDLLWNFLNIFFKLDLNYNWKIQSYIKKLIIFRPLATINFLLPNHLLHYEVYYSYSTGTHSHSLHTQSPQHAAPQPHSWTSLTSPTPPQPSYPKPPACSPTTSQII